MKASVFRWSEVCPPPPPPGGRVAGQPACSQSPTAPAYIVYCTTSLTQPSYLHELHGHQLVTSLLEPADGFADKPAVDRVGLQHDERTLTSSHDFRGELRKQCQERGYHVTVGVSGAGKTGDRVVYGDKDRARLPRPHRHLEAAARTGRPPSGNPQSNTSK